MRAIYALRVGAIAAVIATVVGPAGAQAAEPASQSFETTGEHQFVVPAGVTSVQVTLVGGNGGAGKGGMPGGIPATVTATLAVSPGEALYAEVAGDGQTALSLENEGGYGGGGSGGAPSALGGVGGGGGGGASDLRTCAFGAPPSACAGALSLASRLIVAAGGGGGGGHGQKPPSTAGGNGGSADQSGSAGQKDELKDAGGTGGQRATVSTGGEAGGPSAECKPETGVGCSTGGQLGGGGVGGEGGFGGGGGGGGGGVFGGGGGGGGACCSKLEPANGGGGGGGGGSSGVPTGVSRVPGFSLVPTATGAEPSIAIVWTKPPPAAVTGAPSAVTSTAATLNGTVNPDGSQVSDCHFVIAPAPPGVGSIPCVQQIGGGSTPLAVSASLAALAPATTYTVTLMASSAQGTSSGAAVTFATQATFRASATGGSGGIPTVSALKLSPSRFRRGKHTATLAKTRKKGLPTATTVSFTLSAAATVTLTFERPQTGVIAGHKCVARTRAHRRGRSCTRYVAASGAVRRSAHAGADRIRFEGVLDGGKALAPGAYRLSLAASAAAGTSTAPQHPTFTLAK